MCRHKREGFSKLHWFLGVSGYPPFTVQCPLDPPTNSQRIPSQRLSR